MARRSLLRVWPIAALMLGAGMLASYQPRSLVCPSGRFIYQVDSRDGLTIVFSRDVPSISRLPLPLQFCAEPRPRP